MASCDFLTLATLYLSWLAEILVTNFVEPMNWSKSKQMDGYIFTGCIELVPNLPLWAGFWVHSLLAVLLCQLASREEGSSWEYSCAWHQLKTLINIWLNEVERTTDVF